MADSPPSSGPRSLANQGNGGEGGTPKVNLKMIFIAEFIGCLFSTFLQGLNPSPATQAAVLTTWVYFTSHASSAHLSPAVTLAFVLLGHSRPRESLVYIPAQIAGSLTGTVFVRYLIPSSVESELGCFAPATNLSMLQVFGIELLLTMAFIMMIFVVVFYTRLKLGFGNVGPLLIGVSLYGSVSAGAPFTGGCLNPASLIASPIVIGCSQNGAMHAYLFGQILGAVGAVIFNIIFFGINNNAWYIKWLREEVKNNIHGFEYSVNHERGPRTVMEGSQIRDAGRGQYASYVSTHGGGSDPMPRRTLHPSMSNFVPSTPESQQLVSPSTDSFGVYQLPRTPIHQETKNVQRPSTPIGPLPASIQLPPVAMHSSSSATTSSGTRSLASPRTEKTGSSSSSVILTPLPLPLSAKTSSSHKDGRSA